MRMCLPSFRVGSWSSETRIRRAGGRYPQPPQPPQPSRGPFPNLPQGDLVVAVLAALQHRKPRGRRCCNAAASEVLVAPVPEGGRMGAGSGAALLGTATVRDSRGGRPEGCGYACTGGYHRRSVGRRQRWRRPSRDGQVSQRQRPRKVPAPTRIPACPSEELFLGEVLDDHPAAVLLGV